MAIFCGVYGVLLRERNMRLIWKIDLEWGHERCEYGLVHQPGDNRGCLWCAMSKDEEHNRPRVSGTIAIAESS